MGASVVQYFKVKAAGDDRRKYSGSLPTKTR